MISLKYSKIAIVLLVLNGMLLGINGIPSDERLGTPIARDANPNVCTSSGETAQCSTDCKNLLICSGTTVLASVSCTPSLPYCEKGKCVQNLPASCGDSLQMLCPDVNNYFPDPSDCLKYYYCDSKKRVETFYKCPTGFPFNVTSGKCIKSSSCGVLNCRNQYYAVNPYYPRLGALCSNNSIVNYTYTYCSPSYEVGTSLRCEPKCRQEGDFALIDDKSKYIRCLPSGPGNSLVLTIMPCPNNQEFDGSVSECKVTQSGNVNDPSPSNPNTPSNPNPAPQKAP